MKSLIGIVIASLFISGCSMRQPDPPLSSSESVAIQNHQRVSLRINEKVLSVEVVNTPASITKGLGERDSIGSDGMLFVLPRRHISNFWMHGMRFPLDFIWIDGTTVVGVTAHVPAPKNPSSIDLPSYSSEVPVTHVLELAAGKAEELSIAKGQTIEVAP